MPGIALPSAPKGRLRPSFFFFAAWLTAAAWAQQTVYRCGQEYTNAPADPARCERLAPQAVTIISGTRVQAGSAASPTAPASPPTVRPDTPAQRQRDEMARAILLTELDKARQRHAALLQEQARVQGKPEQASVQAATERAGRDIESLQRELDRRPPATAQP